MEDPLEWLDRLSDAGLKKWLRDAVWLRNALPVAVPPSSSLGVYLSDLFNSPNATRLRLRLREIIPNLLQEWGRFDPPRCLNDLLYLCGTIRCSAAEPIIISIARERLGGLADEVQLRQMCLSVLSGLGPSEATYDLFKYYIRDVRYTALCYRGLYRLRLYNAAVELPTVLDVCRESGDLQAAEIIAKRLFFEYLKPDQHADVVRIFLEEAHPESFETVLKFLKSVDVVNLALWEKASPNQRVEMLKLIVEKAQPNSVESIFEIFKSIGALSRAFFGAVGQWQKFELVRTFLKRGHPGSFRQIIQTLISVDVFNIWLFLQLSSSERLEIMTLLLRRMNPDSFREIYKLLRGVGINLDVITLQNMSSEYVSVRYTELGLRPVEVEDRIPASDLSREITDKIFEASGDNIPMLMDTYFSGGQAWTNQGKVKQPS